MRLENPIHLSEKMEQKFFEKRLTVREIDLLKKRCETYQAREKPEWSKGLLRAYSQYFGFLSALKVKSALKEAWERGYLKTFENQSISLIDFGAGSLGGSLGAIDLLEEIKDAPRVQSCIAIDQDLTPCDWAQKEFSEEIPASVQLSKNFPKNLSMEKSIFIAVDVLNELDPQRDQEVIKKIETLLDQATETTLFIFIEPAGKEINRSMLQWRDRLLAKPDRRYELLLPCTHTKACPALPKKEWCHEDRDYKAPSVYWNLVKEMGFRRHTLSYSMLVFGNQKSAFQTHHARVVSRQLHSKGRCDKWLCADGKLWKASLMTRNQNQQNESYFNSRRGHVLDCNSTGLKPND